MFKCGVAQLLFSLESAPYNFFSGSCSVTNEERCIFVILKHCDCSSFKFLKPSKLSFPERIFLNQKQKKNRGLIFITFLRVKAITASRETAELLMGACYKCGISASSIYFWCWAHIPAVGGTIHLLPQCTRRCNDANSSLSVGLVLNYLSLCSRAPRCGTKFTRLLLRCRVILPWTGWALIYVTGAQGIRYFSQASKLLFLSLCAMWTSADCRELRNRN